MAKMIKCPTCGTQIEVPVAPGGQVIKCPGCGKGLKLVAKVKTPPPGMQAPSPGGSIAGGTIAGGSVSAMTFHGEQSSQQDDLPSLDSNCAVCGRPTEPEDLIEDNGRLVCPDCIKGARSKIDRPDEAPELLDFRGSQTKVRRGKLINFTPSLLGACVAAIVFISCQIYLTLIEPPHGKGRAIASPVGVPHVTPLVDPATPATTQSSTENITPAATQPVENAVAAANPNPLPGTPDPAGAAPAPPPQPEGSTLFPSIDSPTTVPTTPAPTDNPPTVVAIAPGTTPPALPGRAAPAIASSATDPLVQGIDKLQNHDYDAAARLLDSARTKYVLRRLGDKLTPEQQATLVGLAAANLGRNNPTAAMAQLSIVLGTPQTSTTAATPGKGTPSRSAVLNYAIMTMTKRSTPAEVSKSVELVKQYLAGVQNDEYAADIFGTLLDRISAMPSVSKDALMQNVLYLDGYTTTLAQQNHQHELKWGVEWKPRELVANYRAARGRTVATPTPEKLQQELEAAKAKVLQLQQAVEQAKASQGDVIGAQNQYRDALASLADVQMKIEQANAPAPKPRWLEKFQPVVPEANFTVQ